MNFKGSLPTLILQVLSAGPNHGYRIAQQIKQTSKGVLDFREGTLYPALHDLEHKGAVESYERIENGRTRRYYRLTQEGHHSLAQGRAEWSRFAQAIAQILKEA